MDSEISENIKVYVRERPYLATETTEIDKISSVTGSKDGSVSYSPSNNFKFDSFFHSQSTQDEIYELSAKPIVESCLRGYSGTILAYGATGSGKTHTMLGNLSSPIESGILPRCVEQIIQSTHGVAEIYVSFVQIYCEVLGDLLNPANRSLSIRERAGNVFVEGLSKSEIKSFEDLKVLLDMGEKNRATASTLMNATSSRSHAALIITICYPQSESQQHNTFQNNLNGNNNNNNNNNNNSNNSNNNNNAISIKRESSLVLVDLAGSERYSASAGNYSRLEEGKAINLSLSALGNCMSALAEGRPHIPYRDSKLTRLLQGSLGGGSRTSIIVNISPGKDAHGEVLNSLKFASRASKVKVVAKLTRVIDYESLYFAAQKELDNRNQIETEFSLKLSSKNEELETKDKEISYLKDEIFKLKLDIDYWKNLYETGLSGMKNNSTENSTQVNDSINSKNVTFEDVDKKNQELNLLKQKYEAKFLAEQQKATKCSQEVLTLQFELKNAQLSHLSTIEDLKKFKEKIDTNAKESSSRVEALLVEMADYKDKAEIYELATSLFPQEIQNLEQKLLKTTELIEEKDRIISSMVSKAQVAEMENMFSETVARLSARVNSLEKSKAAASSNSIPSSQLMANLKPVANNINELPPLIPQGPKASNSFQRSNNPPPKGVKFSNILQTNGNKTNSENLGNNTNKVGNLW